MNLVPYLEQRYKVGHTNSLLEQFPICGCAYLSLPSEQRRWQTRYCSCWGDGYVRHHHSQRSKSNCAWEVRSAYGHNETHDGCRSSCCLSKSKAGNKRMKEILSKSDSFFQIRCPRSTKRTGHCAWSHCSFLGVIALAIILLFVGLTAFLVLFVATRTILASIVLMTIVESLVVTITLVALMIILILVALMLPKA
jgi:hypothetical protein